MCFFYGSSTISGTTTTPYREPLPNTARAHYLASEHYPINAYKRVRYGLYEVLLGPLDPQGRAAIAVFAFKNEIAQQQEC